MTEKRLWLWEYIGYTGEPKRELLDYQCFDGRARCTEVRLVPVGEPDDGLVTLCVPLDSLEAAIAGTRRGERWESTVAMGMRLNINHDYVAWLNDPSGKGRMALPINGWHRAETPLVCPACGGNVELREIDGGDRKWWVAKCRSCFLRMSHDSVGWRSESEAREAFRRMGK